MYLTDKDVCHFYVLRNSLSRSMVMSLGSYVLFSSVILVY